MVKPKILLIGGAPRSGTTALVHLLNCHQQVCIGMERYHFILIRDQSYSADLFAADRFFDVRPGDTFHDGPFPAEQLKKSEVFGSLKLVGDKLPDIAKQTNAMKSGGVAVDWLFIVRDVMKVCQSHERRLRDDPSWPEFRNYQRAVADWNEANQVILKNFNDPDFHVVRYEDLYSDPDEARALWAHFGLDVSDDFIDLAHMNGIYGSASRLRQEAENILTPEQQDYVKAHADYDSFGKVLDLIRQKRISRNE